MPWALDWRPSALINSQERAVIISGQDFVTAGALEDLQWMDAKLRENFQVKTEILGEGENLAKQVRLLNRVVTLGKGR